MGRGSVLSHPFMGMHCLFRTVNTTLVDIMVTTAILSSAAVQEIANMYRVVLIRTQQAATVVCFVHTVVAKTCTYDTSDLVVEYMEHHKRVGSRYSNKILDGRQPQQTALGEKASEHLLRSERLVK